MNERIKELMKEANKNIPLGKPFWPALEEFSEKFAQLIVAECVQEVESQAILMDAGHDQWNRAIGHTASYLKQHFGVEQ